MLGLQFGVEREVHEFGRDAVRGRQRAAESDAGLQGTLIGLADAILVD